MIYKVLLNSSCCTSLLLLAPAETELPWWVGGKGVDCNPVVGGARATALFSLVDDGAAPAAEPLRLGAADWLRRKRGLLLRV